MIPFHQPTVADRPWIDEILQACSYPGADYTFNNMFFWSGYYGGVAKIDSFAVQSNCAGVLQLYLYPAGQGDVFPVLEQLRQDSESRGRRFCLRGVTEDTRQQLERLYPDKFDFTLYRDAFDYIYAIEELTSLQGKKLQSKRNHINRFYAENPDWSVFPVTEENLPLCRQMTEDWYASRPDGEELEQEKIALARAFEHFTALNMDGLILTDGSRIVAYSMGNRMNREYYDVNFEKAFAQVNGAYSVINQEFSKMIAEKYPEVRYLNREDDMGEPGLRKAKESYHPTILLEKYLACWKQ